uniref:uncharacterized protein LOC120328872 isoform X1 n=3 Tax=Styela clava TaxID=7725 RepID=UPI00193A5306|nr:uncharacterized protein LOC120328872 isoform X1 [Styela clava]XP_039251358.1 uncharacterized protein LOC120328872 isoform X1 [Styela clava]
MFKNMKIITAIVLCWICLSSCKKVSVPRQCIHKIDGTDGVVEFPGMTFNDKARKLFTEGRKMGRICIVHGKIPEHKDLILKIDPSVSSKNWISIGGRISEYGDWENMAILYYNDQGSVNVYTDHQYRTFTRDGENGTKEIMLPGYKFGHLRIVFPRKKTNFTISYWWTDTRGPCKPLTDIADIVTCTDRRRVNSNCTVRCKAGLAPSPILYNLAKDEMRRKLPLMSTTCRGNGFQPPDWFPKISTTYYRMSFDMQPFFHGFIPPQLIPVQRVEPEVEEWYRAIMIHPTMVDIWGEDPMNSHKCVSLENIADVCFGAARPRMVTDGIVNSWVDSCNYPIDYILELFGEDGDTGTDPDTIPLPTKLTPKDRILQMDSEAKLQLLMKLIKQRERYFKYVTAREENPCVVNEYEDLYNTLRKQVTTSKVDSIWDEFRGQVDDKCNQKLNMDTGRKPHCSSNICELVKVKLSGGKTTYKYKYKCASFRGPRRRGECIICRHGKNKLCQTPKASG